MCRELGSVAPRRSSQNSQYHRVSCLSAISAENSGLVGTWKPLSEYVDTPDFLSFQVTLDGALSASSLYLNYKAKPDGKPYPGADGSNDVSLRLPADRTLELTFYTKAKPNEIDILKLSE